MEIPSGLDDVDKYECGIENEESKVDPHQENGDKVHEPTRGSVISSALGT